MKKNMRDFPRVIVGAFILNKKNELLLLKQKNWKGKYTCPGGKVEIGETFVEALTREVREETNLRLKNIKKFEIVEGLNLKSKYKPGDEHFIFVDFIAKAKNESDLKINKESISAKWKTPEAWLKKKDVFPHNYIVQAIEKIRDDKTKSYEEMYVRALADYQNLLKRTNEEKREFIKYANEQMILEILPVYDNLKVSLNHIDEDAKNNGWAEGIKYVVKQFDDILKNLGLEEISIKNKKFDPGTMEALEGKGDKVKKVVKSGYTLKGKVIVAAKVVLGK